MNHFSIFGHTFNGLEFVTYLIIPSAIVVVVLVYIFFNYRLIRISLESDDELLEELDDQCDEKLKTIDFEIVEEEFFIEKTQDKL